MSKTVCVVGLGLIGASLAMHIKGDLTAFGVSQCIDTLIGIDVNPLSIQMAQEDGLIDIGALSLQALDNASARSIDVLILAVPTQIAGRLLQDIAALMQAGTLKMNLIISDACSTKENIEAAAREYLAPVAGDLGYFVGAHPIAGAEHSGYHARRGHLFWHHKTIICPSQDTHQDTLALICALWRKAGAHIDIMDAKTHDRILAHTSHLPHLLAFALVAQLAGHCDNLEIFRYGAGGFKDFSRIAGSDALMWRDIFLANKTAVLDALDDYTDQLERLKCIIQKEHALLDTLNDITRVRKHVTHLLAKPTHKEHATMQVMTTQAPKTPIAGTIRVASDKSISHRSIIFGALAQGTTQVVHFLGGLDALCTLNAFRQMGVVIEEVGGNVIIEGVGLHGLRAPLEVLDMGNSGTSMRLLAGLLAGQDFDSTLIGDASLSKRPMGRIQTPLEKMGGKIQTTGAKQTAPLSITGQPLKGITYTLPMASAQVKSAILLAGLYAKGATTVIEDAPTRDHTERMLKAFGAQVDIARIDGKTHIHLAHKAPLEACQLKVPADISSAAFFMVLAAITQGDITLTEVGINPTRTGVIEVLRLMGVDIKIHNMRDFGYEPVADIRVKGGGALKGIDIPKELVPLAIDEFPAIFIAAALAQGTTRLTGARELRVKESDRIGVMAQGLSALGINCEVLDDGLVIEGSPQGFTGGQVSAHHDHRIAMSFAIAGARSQAPIHILGSENVVTSFPNFVELCEEVGLPILVEDRQ